MVLVRTQWPIALNFAFCAAIFLYVLQFPLNHDVAWLMEATRRWVGGGQLYVDIVEINPPLIFIETVILTAGTLTKGGFLAGVSLVILLSGLWIGRWQGATTGFIASVVLACSGIIGFGQRDHLALIFLLPFVMAPDNLSRRERIALAAYAFLGVGLKPYFLLMPAAYVAAQCVMQRSLAPIWALQNMVLGALIGAWALAVVLIWPAYVSEIIPLGQFVYGAFGNALEPFQFNVSLAILATCLIAVARCPEQRPLAAATIGALLSFFIQGRYWAYHLIPAIGLASMTAIQTGRALRGAFRLPLLLGGTGFAIANLMIGPQHYIKPFIPRGVDSVLFLADAVPVAYPMVLECGVENASRYPTFWTLPGAWNAMEDPARRREAWRIFHREVDRANQDIRKYRPQIIYEDMRPPKFDRPFRFSDWFDLSDYRRVGQKHRVAIWVRRDLSPAILEREPCSFS